MSLPSNYTKLDYIESHGTEYFDTGFKPSQDTRVVMDVENLATSTTPFFGARTTSSTYSYVFWQISSTSFRSDYGGSSANQQSISVSSTLGRYTIDKNKNVCTVQNVTVTNTAQTFSCAYNMYLLGLNENGSSEGRYVTVKLYSCKIYDNTTLVRDFIPAMNASGAIGLWDDVNSTFYTNAGTGTFDYHVGTKHRTRIAGTGYDVQKGRTLIGGTGYDVKKARTLIGGTGYDIGFGTPVGELDVGTSVYMDVDGVSTEFLVVQQGIPETVSNESQVYDSSCDGTWVLIKNIYDLRAWDDDGLSYYKSSSIDAYMNGDFLNLFDSNIQSLIKQVKIPYWDGNSTSSVGQAKNGANGLSRKFFLPSVTECGYNHTYTSDNFGILGERLQYFKNATDATRIASYDGEATGYWTRNIPKDKGTRAACLFYYDGSYGELYSYYDYYGFRPMCILPSEEAKVDSDYNIIAS